MKARWLIITLLLAFPFAFAFFLSEARRGEKRATKPALVVTPSADALPFPARSSDQYRDSPSNLSGPVSETSATTPDVSNEYTLALASPATTTKPTLLQGTFAKEDGSFIYDADAKLRLSKDVILSSPTGVMVSNEKQTVFAGDMQVEAGKNIITAHEGVLDTTTNQMKATVASISFTNENNQLIRMTGENVTLELPAEKSGGDQTKPATSVSSAPTPPRSTQ